jgi:hypothetical protein
MRYLITQAYIADMMLWSLEQIKYSLISHVYRNINKVTL